MKKLILLLSLVACSLFSNAQGPSWLWAFSSSGGSYEYPNGISVDTSGHFFVGFRGSGTVNFGAKSATSGGADNPMVAGFDTSGLCNWIQEYTYSGGYDYNWGFCKDRWDNSIQGGVVNSGGSSPMYIEKINKSGVQKWSKTVTGGGLAAMGLAVDGAGNIYVTGNFQSFSSPTFGSTTLTYSGSYQAMFLAKMDSNGNWLWAKMIDGTGAGDGYDVGRGINVDQYANVYVTGGYYNQPVFGGTPAPSQNGNPYPSLYVAEYDSSGNYLNLATATNAGFNNGDCCTLSHIVVDSCGYFYVTGYFQGTAQFGTFTLTNTNGNEGAYVAKGNFANGWQWANSIISTSGNDNGQAIALDKTSDVYVGGNYNNNLATLTNGNVGIGDSTITGGDLFIVKYANSTGAILWAKSQNAGTGDGIGGITVDNNNYMYVTGCYSGSNLAFGTTNLTSTSVQTVFVAKLDTTPPRQIIPTVYLSYCPGAVDSVSYTVRGTFNAGNVFTAQLSDSTGNFVNPVNIGSVTSTTSGTIIITIPAGTTPGSTYLIRVISSNPAGSSWANGCGAYFVNNVYPNDFYVTIGTTQLNNVKLTPVNPDICAGGALTLTATGGATYLWYNGDTTSSISVNPTQDTIYSVLVSNGGCTFTASDTITVTPILPLVVNPQSPAVCNGQGVILTVPTTGSNYVWAPDSTLNKYTGDTVIANPTILTVYTVTGTNTGGCGVSGTDTVKVNLAPPFYINPGSSTVCDGSPTTLTVSPNGSNYVWSPSAGLSTTTGNVTVVLDPTVNVTYTVTGLDSLGCAVTCSDTLTVIAAPNKPTITISANGDTLTSSAGSYNQWYFNGQAISGQTGNKLIITGHARGYYTVTVVNPANGCTTTSDSTTSVNQVSIISDQLLIYPNPFNTNIFVKIKSSASNVNEWSLQLTDVLGRTLFTKPSLNYNNEIDLSNLSGGVYFITVINKTARAVFPVVKQN